MTAPGISSQTMVSAARFRPLDALQLSVALNLHQTLPIDQFVCADHRLCVIALLEGLAVVNPEQP